MKNALKVAGLALLFSTTGRPVEASMPTPPPPQAQEEVKPSQAPSLEKKAKDIQDKFNNLTDQQKEEIFQLTKELQQKQIELLKKYVEFGLLTQEEADAMIKAMEKQIR